MTSHQRIARLGAALAVLSIFAGCGEKPQAGAAPGAGMPPPEVAVMTVAPQRLTISNELPGRLEATRVAQVRARVAGIVQKRAFREGSEVKA
ncbi:MAG: efflux transporter periplasmic adaptor subunit, partial [Oxalobacteraceae bacterium]